MKKFVLACLALTTVSGAMAQSYIGVSVGASHVNLDCPANVSCRGTDVGFKLYGGAAFTPMVSGEIAYIDFGSGKVNASANGDTLSGSFASQALTISAVLRAPIAPKLFAVGRLGLASMTSVVKASGSVSGLGTFSGDAGHRSTQPYMGLGLEYAFASGLRGVAGLDLSRAEFSADTGETTTGAVRLLSFGGQFDF
jgi:hypothetical protein